MTIFSNTEYDNLFIAWRFVHEDPVQEEVTDSGDQKVIEDELDIKQLLREVWNSVKNTLIEMKKTWNHSLLY